MASILQKYNSSKKHSEWAEMVQRCRESGKSVGEWCSENGIAVSTYYSRQHKLSRLLNEKPEANEFYEIDTTQPPSSPAATVHLKEFSVDIYNSATEESLAVLIRVLRSC